ncbi:MAG: sugar ABC transporter substrate-binding protein [Acetatifactor sp.]|nr:sugar ABC transporter substrate-binding protein [Acetatifactor sp.]
MKRKVFSYLLIAAMVSSLFAGCGSKADTPDTSAASEETQVEEVKEEETATEDSVEDVTIRVSLWDYSSTQYYKDQIAAFEKAYPHIKVDVAEAPAGDYEDMIITKMAGRENYDVVFTKGLPSLSALISMNYVQPLDDYIANDADFDKSAYSNLTDQMQMNGKTYGVPYRKDNILLYYNKDLFDAAGVDYPQDGMTMDDYYELAKKMTSGSGNEKIYGAHLHTWASCVFLFPRRVGQFDPWGTDKSALKPYYETFLKMQDEGLIMDYGTLKASNTHYSGVFYNKQVAMMEMGTWFINMLVENADFNWGVCSVPNVDGVGNTCAVGGVTPVMIGAYAEHPDEAWEFIKFVTGEEGAKILASNGILPGYSCDAVDEIFDALPGAPENLSDYLSADTFYVDTPLNPNGKEADSIISEEHDLIMTKSISVDDGLKEMEERVNAVIE